VEGMSGVRCSLDWHDAVPTWLAERRRAGKAVGNIGFSGGRLEAPDRFARIGRRAPSSPG
jgi:hypothetical protein